MSGELRLYIGAAEQPVAVEKFAAGQQGAITIQLKDVDKVLQPGVNKVRLELTGGNVLPYTLSWSYRGDAGFQRGCPADVDDDAGQERGQGRRHGAVDDQAAARQASGRHGGGNRWFARRADAAGQPGRVEEVDALAGQRHQAGRRGSL